jgi:tripartite ATP-independent transporter DctP family solute receptor
MRFAILAATTAAIALTIGAGTAEAQTKLKFAHVYETSEPYHTEAVWAAQEIAKRTNNKYQIDVFPASALGNEQQINQALPLGTIDMIYTGTSFAGASYKPMAISGAPGMVRDYAHWKAYRDSDLFKELSAGYDKATGNHTISFTYYGARHVTSNKPITKPADMQGMKLRVPQAPLYLMFAKAVGANASPIAFAEVYLALQQGTVDGQENPLPTIQAKKFYEVQSHISLTAHITDSLMAIASGPLWKRLSAPEQQIFSETFKQAAARASDQIDKVERELPEWFKSQGKTVVVPDKAAFMAAAAKVNTDPAAGAGWSKEQYDRFQALGK